MSQVRTITTLIASVLLLSCGQPDEPPERDDHALEPAAAAHETADGHGHGHGHGHGDGPGDPHADHEQLGTESWAVTAWGAHFEIFAETDPLIAGEVSNAHTHVTLLEDFSPLREGLVEIVLRHDGAEKVFGEELPLRDGIFDVAIRPRSEGIHELLFRVEAAARREEIFAGRVQVGTARSPGGFERARISDAGGEIISFLKEQQWKTRFATAWVSEGVVHLVARGPGRVRPVAGGEIVLASPMNAIVGARPWPYVGREVIAGERLFELTPHVAADRSLAQLQAVETEKRTALAVAKERLVRLESLLSAQASSPAEVEGARARVISLGAQHEAARSDLHTARARRAGGPPSGESVPVLSPLSGRIAEVRAGAGQVVGAGETLARVVAVEPFWVEVFLRPAQATALGEGASALALRGPGMDEPIFIPPEEVRLISRSPEVSRANGTVTCIFEVAGNASPILGSALEVEVTLPATRSGIVLPASSIVDDGGTPIVFVQLDGEGFLRSEVEITARQGSLLLVTGVEAGERVVTAGGAAIRRATLVSSGVGHGHVH